MNPTQFAYECFLHNRGTSHAELMSSNRDVVQGSESAAAYRRTLQQRVNDPLVPLFGRAAERPDRAALGSSGQRSFLQDPKGLPPNVHLLTLKDNGDGKVLVRLAHLYQVTKLPLTSVPTATWDTRRARLRL